MGLKEESKHLFEKCRPIINDEQTLQEYARLAERYAKDACEMIKEGIRQKIKDEDIHHNWGRNLLGTTKVVNSYYRLSFRIGVNVVFDRSICDVYLNKDCVVYDGEVWFHTNEVSTFMHFVTTLENLLAAEGIYPCRNRDEVYVKCPNMAKADYNSRYGRFKGDDEGKKVDLEKKAKEFISFVKKHPKYFDGKEKKELYYSKEIEFCLFV